MIDKPVRLSQYGHLKPRLRDVSDCLMGITIGIVAPPHETHERWSPSAKSSCKQFGQRKASLIPQGLTSERGYIITTFDLSPSFFEK
jgi:hypothetical protein